MFKVFRLKNIGNRDFIWSMNKNLKSSHNINSIKSAPSDVFSFTFFRSWLCSVCFTLGGLIIILHKIWNLINVTILSGARAAFPSTGGLCRASARLLELVALCAPSWFKTLWSVSVSSSSQWPVMGPVSAARGSHTLGFITDDHCSLFVNIVSTSAPEVLFAPNFFKENGFFIIYRSCSVNHLLSVSRPFPTKVQWGLQFGEFLLVHGSFFHLVGEEMGPRRGLGLAPWGSWAENKYTHVGTQDGS